MPAKMPARLRAIMKSTRPRVLNGPSLKRRWQSEFRYVARHLIFAMKFSKLLVTVVLGVAVLALAGCSKPADAAKSPHDNAIPVQVAKVESVPLDRAVSVIGTLFAKDQATVGAQVEGQCEKTLVEFGDRLTTGQEI